jgi:hypothetical protein
VSTPGETLGVLPFFFQIPHINSAATVPGNGATMLVLQQTAFQSLVSATLLIIYNKDKDIYNDMDKDMDKDMDNDVDKATAPPCSCCSRWPSRAWSVQHSSSYIIKIRIRIRIRMWIWIRQ